MMDFDIADNEVQYMKRVNISFPTDIISKQTLALKSSD